VFLEHRKANKQMTIEDYRALWKSEGKGSWITYPNS